MKLSDFAASAQVEDRDTLLHAAAAFNKTRTEYPRDATVHRLFVRQAAKRPEAIAVVDSVRIITYGDLDEQSNKLARLLVDYGLTAEGSVAVMIDRCVDMVTAPLGTLKTGGASLPINHDVPYDRVRFMLQEARCRFLISGKLHIRAINRLQWDCPDLACIVCLDSNNIHSEPEATGEMMKEEVWDYLRRDMFDDISGGGWRSSYTGEWLSREVMD